jgi:hypothetical protein
MLKPNGHPALLAFSFADISGLLKGLDKKI